MGFPLLTLVPGLVRTVAKFVTGDDNSVLAKAANILENVSIPPEKQAEMQAALQQHEEKMAEIIVRESTTMVQSPSKYVAWARPTMLYGATLSTLYLVICVGKSLWTHEPIDTGAIGFATGLISPMWGVAAYYSNLRTKEKLNGNGEN